jgi:hypothetical protein
MGMTQIGVNWLVDLGTHVVVLVMAGVTIVVIFRYDLRAGHVKTGAALLAGVLALAISQVLHLLGPLWLSGASSLSVAQQLALLVASWQHFDQDWLAVSAAMLVMEYAVILTVRFELSGEDGGGEVRITRQHDSAVHSSAHC